MKTTHITAKGKVQGVFFRANVQKKAEELGLKGYVRNLPNGDVEAVAQGVAEHVQQLVAFMESSPGASRVEQINTKEREEGAYSAFEVH